MASSIMDSRESLTEVVPLVNGMLNSVAPYSLEAEVIATAMIYLQGHPESTIENALRVGLNDWDI
jgi:hypothetical protein